MFIRMIHMRDAEHVRLSYRWSYEYRRFFLVIIRTRFRAGGARDGERGGAVIFCVRTLVFFKEDRGPLHAVCHAAYSSRSSLPQIGVLVRWGGARIPKYLSSFRNGIFLPGPMAAFILYLF